jgi:hypothetical protein
MNVIRNVSGKILFKETQNLGSYSGMDWQLVMCDKIHG